MENKFKSKKIDPNAWFTLQDIVRDSMFPWYKSFSKIRDVVASDAEKKNILNPIVKGESRGKKYLFKGSNIIKFINAVETGKVKL